MKGPASRSIRIAKVLVENYKFNKLDTPVERACFILGLDADKVEAIERDEYYLLYSMEDNFPVFAHHSMLSDKLFEKEFITIHLPSIAYMSEEPDQIVGDIIMNEVHEMCHWAAQHDEYPNVGNDPDGWNDILVDIVQDTYDEDYTWDDHRELSPMEAAKAARRAHKFKS